MLAAFFGTLRLMLLAPFRGRLPVDGTSIVGLRVWPNDMDLNFHVNNGRYFTLADLGRIDWWVRTGVLQAGRRRGWNPNAGDATAKFSRELRLFQAYEIHSRMLGFDEKWVYNEHRFVRKGFTHVTMAVRSAIVSKQGRVPPADWLALVGWTKPSPPLPEWVAAWSRVQDQLAAELRASRPSA